ncbi:MAG: hypothetical protein GY754_03310 [bacterium]|nr:hypothetical protein [bacterium]
MWVLAIIFFIAMFINGWLGIIAGTSLMAVSLLAGSTSLLSSFLFAGASSLGNA